MLRRTETTLAEIESLLSEDLSPSRRLTATEAARLRRIAEAGLAYLETSPGAKAAGYCNKSMSPSAIKTRTPDDHAEALKAACEKGLRLVRSQR